MEKQIKKRLKELLLLVINDMKSMPKSDEYFIIKKQLIRSMSSSGANYNAACRAKSKKDFKYKLKIVIEELDESYYWIDILKSLDDNSHNFSPHLDETNQLLAIMISSVKTMEVNQKSKNHLNQKSK